MPVAKMNCQYCQRIVSKSNVSKHEASCGKPKEKKLTPSERQLSIDPKIRKARAQKAQKVGQEKRAAERLARVESAPFCDLNNSEKRDRIYNEQHGCCLMCKNNEWLGRPITLELDHINGDRRNETRDNLRLICPNCHSQTDTYKTLNMVKKGLKKYSDDEIIPVLMSEESLYKVLLKLNMNPHGGNYTRLRRIIREHGIRQDLIF